MPRVVKAAIWIAAFAACAGVGALLASHTNPFPPGVEDPGVRTSSAPATGTSTPPPANVRHWTGAGGARTDHDLFVGGRCATAWRIAVRFTVDDAGAVEGTGTARLSGDLRCDFHTAQVQAETVVLAVAGHRGGPIIRLALTVSSMDPSGSDDYGGLTHTLRRFPLVKVRSGAGRADAVVRVSDGDQGTYGATYHVLFSCGDC